MSAMGAERMRRWRLALGDDGSKDASSGLSAADARMDRTLAMLYGEGKGAPETPRDRRGGRGPSTPTVVGWLGDVREMFPTPVAQVMQRDAMQAFGVAAMLADPEALEAMEPDVGLAAALVAMKGELGERTRATARVVIRKVVDDLVRRLADPLRQAVSGSLDRSARTRRPRHSEIDWNRTVRANLRHFQPEYGTVVPATLVGYGRRRRTNSRDIILCVDQSGSMGESVVHSGVLGAVMASLPAVSTRIVAFDTSVIDLTDKVADPVDLLFGFRMGGGTDIDGAMGYCESKVTRPDDTIMVLISDLYEGGVSDPLLRRAARLVASGVRLIVLLALSDSGAPAYDRALAAKLASLGVPSFACSPDCFPDLMASAIRRDDIYVWAAKNGIVSVPAH